MILKYQIKILIQTTTTTEYYYYWWRISKLELKLLNLNHFQSYGLVPSFVVNGGGGGNWVSSTINNKYSG
ncbi:POU domain, class 2, transcription factor 1, variant 4 [Dermatophagoides farinae]|uniref:POU domain, class 2, transcription factor 1, variant 4 n=1 Tax=Dermatophagoides farinae TaxID=6954 RepID=A0A922IAE7_DERFA|nr:POU domain, class 2, transcription factor 1, variant 4 [Dermatophagoides farinae]